MNVREHLLALEEELRRLKGDGDRTVMVSEQGLARLRSVVAETGAKLRPGETPALEKLKTPSPTVAVREESEQSYAPAPKPAAPPRIVAVAPASASLLGPAPTFELPAGGKQERWTALREIVLKDPVCCANVFPGKRIVFGVGSVDARIMFVGEAPGADEEDIGEPFVGRAGQLLNRMIKAMGLEREQVYIGNILNWRPSMPRNPDGSQTGNRPPTLDEMGYCLPFIRAQIEVVAPRVLVALGKTAVDGLLGADRFKTMGAARGAWHDYAGIPLRATYHPSYLLRQEGLKSEAALKIKRDAWEDLLAVMERAELPISEKQRGYFRKA